LEVVRGVGEEHRRAGERDRDRRRELDPLRLPRREDERDERVALALEGEGAVVAERLEPAGERARLGRARREQRAVDLQRIPSTTKLCWSTVPSEKIL
jgi:hypothetical protein